MFIADRFEPAVELDNVAGPSSRAMSEAIACICNNVATIRTLLGLIGEGISATSLHCSFRLLWGRRQRNASIPDGLFEKAGKPTVLPPLGICVASRSDLKLDTTEIRSTLLQHLCFALIILFTRQQCVNNTVHAHKAFFFDRYCGSIYHSGRTFAIHCRDSL